MDLTSHTRDNLDITKFNIYVRNLDYHHLATEKQLSNRLICFVRLINDGGFQKGKRTFHSSVKNYL